MIGQAVILLRAVVAAVVTRDIRTVAKNREVMIRQRIDQEAIATTMKQGAKRLREAAVTARRGNHQCLT
jgi:hypothetical protein